MNSWSWYWVGWFVVTAFSFLVPEVYALATGNPANTLSANIWKLEGAVPHQVIWAWIAAHFLIGGLIAVLLIWLLFHFTFVIWT